MKNLIFICCLFSIACVSTGLKARSVASAKCTIENYRDIVFQDNAEPPKCDLRQANLQEVNLRNTDLREANLREANLRKAKLRWADLQGANLYGADLWRADLRTADLRFADLRGANLWNADLRGADLRGADLRLANLQGADLRDTKVTRTQVELLEAQGKTGYIIFKTTETEPKSNGKTYVCNKAGATAKALNSWGGTVIEVIYDPDKNGYWVIMIDRRGREKIRFIPDDC